MTEFTTEAQREIQKTETQENGTRALNWNCSTSRELTGWQVLAARFDHGWAHDAEHRREREEAWNDVLSGLLNFVFLVALICLLILWWRNTW